MIRTILHQNDVDMLNYVPAKNGVELIGVEQFTNRQQSELRLPISSAVIGDLFSYIGTCIFSGIFSNIVVGLSRMWVPLVSL